MRCDNDSSMGSGIVAPQCFISNATTIVKVIYDKDMGLENADELYLCDVCSSVIRTEAEKHGYKVVRARVL